MAKPWGVAGRSVLPNEANWDDGTAKGKTTNGHQGTRMGGEVEGGDSAERSHPGCRAALATLRLCRPGGEGKFYCTAEAGQAQRKLGRNVFYKTKPLETRNHEWTLNTEGGNYETKPWGGAASRHCLRNARLRPAAAAFVRGCSCLPAERIIGRWCGHGPALRRQAEPARFHRIVTQIALPHLRCACKKPH